MIVNLESSGAFIYGRVSRWERETPEIPKWFILGSHWIFGPLRPQLTRHERHWCMGADFEAARQQGNKATRYVAMLTHRCPSFLSKSNCRMALQFRQILYVVWFSGFFSWFIKCFFQNTFETFVAFRFKSPFWYLFDICIYLFTNVYFDLSLYFYLYL